MALKFSDVEIEVSKEYSDLTNIEIKNIDPMTIALIIQIAFQVLNMCMKTRKHDASAVKDFAERRPVLARLTILKKIPMNRKDKDTIGEIIYNMCIHNTPDRLFAAYALSHTLEREE